MKIAVFGAFGFQNTGDQLIGMATEQLLKEINPELSVDLYSIQQFFSYNKKKEGNVQFIGRRYQKFYDRLNEYDAVIIGGGALLLPIHDFDPFLLCEDRKYPKAAWNALGSQYTPVNDPRFEKWYGKIKNAVDKLEYVSVRSQSTKRLLETVGCQTEKIHLVPDAASGLRIECDVQSMNELKKKIGVSFGKKCIGVSIGPELQKEPLNSFQQQLAIALNEIIKKEPDTDIVIFPFGQIYGDVTACETFAALVPGARYAGSHLTPKETWCLVSLLDTYLTVRYHGAVAGLAQGIPTIIMDCYLSNGMLGSKLRDFAYQFGLDQYYLSPIIGICERPETRNFFHTIGNQDDLAQLILNKIYLAGISKSYWREISEKAHADVRSHFRSMCSKLNLLTK
ncbi:polysaccharide pyruvyl transferase family protein [Clostridium boliviensis]|uniref:Polysaccharide pyruvyl transferase family protein n=1 Tax=Clostridium boliviensis TaxID=318465 RepID=A0ABU4GQK6_9CLOT|nr:polysaccharide pyruvyl transferase family protein [Clostridium boliviensis]MDW2799925.1 polysaccharide pyruvyl transferase family protein [Clostridium boliviensis]